MSDGSLYNWYKEHHICPRCGRNEAAKGRVYCLDCLDKQAVATMIWKKNHDISEKNKEFCHNRYQKAKKDGICVRCFKNKAREGKTSCIFCFNKIREKQAIYQRLKRAKEKENKQ